jgi:NADH-quinone oxidoreductase subunit I
MGYLGDGVKALGTTLANLLRKPVTAQFPVEVRPRPERYRTSFALPDDEHGEIACVGCLTCEKICPSGVIRVKAAPKRESPVTGKKRAYPEEFSLDLSACIFCELCVQVCNTDALVMVKVPEQPGYAREELVLTMERLRENARTRPLSWATGEKLMQMQESKEKKGTAVASPSPSPSTSASTSASSSSTDSNATSASMTAGAGGE